MSEHPNNTSRPYESMPSEQLTAEVLGELKRLESDATSPSQTRRISEEELGRLMIDHAPALIAVAEQVRDLQKRIAELEAALKLARSHVISHHAAHLNGGELGWCPVCHKEDGTEPEMDLIDSALNGGAK